MLFCSSVVLVSCGSVISFHVCWVCNIIGWFLRFASGFSGRILCDFLLGGSYCGFLRGVIFVCVFVVSYCLVCFFCFLFAFGLVGWFIFLLRCLKFL